MADRDEYVRAKGSTYSEQKGKDAQVNAPEGKKAVAPEAKAKMRTVEEWDAILEETTL